uniref:Uncharacterized protein n=1 Tax=Chromera velia CCMP2878 TaxID=1169474 RepID=A0A0G4GZM3_9ALVE|eukprot:Cvel_24006.t1-p1 / transcript=Cvel_24006.t1 / gene=Cvel_24006 / organism=Chromera_velia_CCMP2878 / gene_product=hypothetical protein / transcript_product=hypothetical protein / location=Cvel_scaffold2545:22636-23625(-) / protein_length=330 / sequence_SO=supercontig / SO=protein_coding / is_pseudo=false
MGDYKPLYDQMGLLGLDDEGLDGSGGDIMTAPSDPGVASGGVNKLTSALSAPTGSAAPAVETVKHALTADEMYDVSLREKTRGLLYPGENEKSVLTQPRPGQTDVMPVRLESLDRLLLRDLYRDEASCDVDLMIIETADANLPQMMSSIERRREAKLKTVAGGEGKRDAGRSRTPSPSKQQKSQTHNKKTAAEAVSRVPGHRPLVCIRVPAHKCVLSAASLELKQMVNDAATDGTEKRRASIGGEGDDEALCQLLQKEEGQKEVNSIARRPIGAEDLRVSSPRGRNASNRMVNRARPRAGTALVSALRPRVEIRSFCAEAIHICIRCIYG